MHNYMLYGIDRFGRVVDVNEIGARSPEQAGRIAERRARQYAKAELWDGMLCERRFARSDGQPAQSGAFGMQRLRQILLG